jgi:hypothetical protein
VLLKRIMPQIEAYALVEKPEVSQYWKIPQYYGINFSLRPGNEPNAAFDGLVSLSTKGWSFYGDSQQRDAVWNFEGDMAFLSPAVKWANLALSFVDVGTLSNFSHQKNNPQGNETTRGY